MKKIIPTLLLTASLLAGTGETTAQDQKTRIPQTQAQKDSIQKVLCTTYKKFVTERKDNAFRLVFDQYKFDSTEQKKALETMCEWGEKMYIAREMALPRVIDTIKNDVVAKPYLKECLLRLVFEQDMKIQTGDTTKDEYIKKFMEDIFLNIFDPQLGRLLDDKNRNMLIAKLDEEIEKLKIENEKLDNGIRLLEALLSAGQKYAK